MKQDDIAMVLNVSQSVVSGPLKEHIVGHPELEKKSVGIFEYILASMFKVYLDVF